MLYWIFSWWTGVEQSSVTTLTKTEPESTVDEDIALSDIERREQERHPTLHAIKKKRRRPRKFSLAQYLNICDDNA